MSRRAKPEKRDIQPDARYHSIQVQAFINNVMRRGKKSLAARLVYDAFQLMEQRTKKSGLEVFEQAVKNVSPMMEVKPRRVGGATYQVPVEVPGDRQAALALRWIVDFADARKGQPMKESLAADASIGARPSVATPMTTAVRTRLLMEAFVN